MGGTCKFLRRLRRNGGFSMIEIMIVGGLIAFIAVAIMPAIFSVVDNSKSSGFRAVCAGAVRAKMQEYINGVADGAMGSNYVPTGFDYTKKRFLDNWASCQINPTPAGPGFRESVVGNALASGAEYINGKPAIMQGFQLWVNIRRYNPRTLSGSIPTRDCATSTDQLFRLGDALEVTVTGMVRTDTAVSAGGRGCNPVGKLYDFGHTACSGTPPTGNGTRAHPSLECSATEIIYPPRLPFRYYLSSDGKIRNFQTSITFVSGNVIQSSLEASEAHFRNIWLTGGASGDTTLNQTVAGSSGGVVANIRSFAVAPDNSWVYVLRPGELSLYGPCNDTNPSVNGKNYQGIPDCPRTPQWTWATPHNLETIAVDFGTTLGTDPNLAPADDSVYALLSATSTNTISMGSAWSLMKLTLPAGGSSTTVAMSENNTFSLPTGRPRIRGMFIAQTFPTGANSNPNLFFFDNTCYAANGQALNTSTYCASIFNSSDSNMMQVVREMPLQVESISY